VLAVASPLAFIALKGGFKGAFALLLPHVQASLVLGPIGIGDLGRTNHLIILEGGVDDSSVFEAQRARSILFAVEVVAFEGEEGVIIGIGSLAVPEFGDCVYAALVLVGLVALLGLDAAGRLEGAGLQLHILGYNEDEGR
jgi:hypothetical protein